MFLFTVQTYISSFEKHGYALSMAFATMFSRHAISLALTDAFLVGSTAFCVLFAKALSKGLIKYYWTGVIIQHCFQIMVLTCAITWTFKQCVPSQRSSPAFPKKNIPRRWPWVQSGFLTLHSLVSVIRSPTHEDNKSNKPL